MLNAYPQILGKRTSEVCGAFVNYPWGSDWTKEWKGDGLQSVVVNLPDQIPYQPELRKYYREKQRLINRRKDIVYKTVMRKPVALTGDEIKDQFKDGQEDLLLKPVFYGLQTTAAHNEGTKFGDRWVIIATPIFINKDFFTKEDRSLIKYFIAQARFEIYQLLPLLTNNGNVDKNDQYKIFLRSKKEALLAALADGNLAQYLALHDRIYPSDSENALLKEIAMNEIKKRYGDLKTAAQAYLGMTPKITEKFFQTSHKKAVRAKELGGDSKSLAKRGKRLFPEQLSQS